jgi:hypothetical protein
VNEYKIGVLKENGVTGILIHSQRYGFIARASLAHNDNHLYEVMGPVARKGFGTLLYQSLAKYASTVSGHIVSARDGDTRERAYGQWSKLHKTVGSRYLTAVPDELNENVLDSFGSDAAPLMLGYSLPASQSYIESLVDMNTSVDRDRLMSLWDNTSDYFTYSYDEDSTHWIDIDEPLDDKDKRALYPLRAIIPVTALPVSWDLAETSLADVEAGEISRTKGPLSCVVDIDGDMVMVNGHHRYIEDLLLGKDHIEVIIEHNEYLDGFIADVDRPDKSHLCDGLASLRGEDELLVIKKAYHRQVRQEAEQAFSPNRYAENQPG